MLEAETRAVVGSSLLCIGYCKAKMVETGVQAVISIGSSLQ